MRVRVDAQRLRDFLEGFLLELGGGAELADRFVECRRLELPGDGQAGGAQQEERQAEFRLDAVDGVEELPEFPGLGEGAAQAVQVRVVAVEFDFAVIRRLPPAEQADRPGCRIGADAVAAPLRPIRRARDASALVHARRHHNPFAASSTWPAWASGFTLRQILATLPSAPTRKLDRSMPK